MAFEGYIDLQTQSTLLIECVISCPVQLGLVDGIDYLIKGVAFRSVCFIAHDFVASSRICLRFE